MDFIGVAIGSALAVVYLLYKNWIANNIFGLAFSVQVSAAVCVCVRVC